MKKSGVKFIIAFIIWLLFRITGIQTFYFEDVKGWNVNLAKVSHLIFIYLIVLVLSHMIERRKDSLIKHWLVVSVIFWGINIVVLLMTWPGFWSWDDVAILQNAQQYNFTPWQHFMSGLWHTICLQTVPFSSGVLIVQVFVAGLIVGYCLATVSHILFTGHTKKMLLCEGILFLPTISAPVMMYLLTGFRMGIYSFLELFLIVKVFALLRKKEKVSVSDMIIVTLLTILVGAWRSEAIYYPITILLCLLVLGKDRLRLYKAVIFMLLALVVTRGIGKWNDELIGNDNYSLSATVLPITELIKNADEDEDLEEILAINKVLDCTFIWDNPEYGGEAVLWSAIREGYTQEMLNDYYKAYLQLALKYPGTVIKETYLMFLRTSGVIVLEGGYTTMRTTCSNTDAATLWRLRGVLLESWQSNGSILNGAIDTELRDTTIRKIAFIDEEGKVVSGFKIVWNLLIPITLSVLCFLYCLLKRKWDYVTLYICVLARVPLIVLTACAPYFMYYLSVYLVGYVLSFMVIIDGVGNQEKRKKFG